MSDRNSYRMLNEVVFDQLNTPGMEKQAVDAINDFTRIRMREDGFYGKILPELTITNDELDRQVDTDLPVKVIDREPDSPAAISIPFATLPVNVYIRGSRYRIMFDRIVTPRFIKDVDELRTYSMDIRQVLSDNAIKDMLAEEDGKFIAAINTALVARDTPTPWSGVVQWESISGGITRETVMDALKIMTRTDAHLVPTTALINTTTYYEFRKWGRDEVGGDFSQALLKDAAVDENFMGLRWVGTIKRALVPDDALYLFADPKFIGKAFALEQPTMYIKREAFMLEFFAYQTKGGGLGHTAGFVRADFV